MQLTGPEAQLVRLAALTHDIGECEHPELLDEVGFIQGDKLYGTISSRDKDEERQVRAYILGQLGGPFDRLTENELALLDGIIDNTEPEHPAHRTFNRAEHLGYYETGIMAGQVLLDTCRDLTKISRNRRARELARLAVDVSRMWRAELSADPGEFAYVDQRVAQTTDIFGLIEEDIAPQLEVPIR